MPHVCLNSNTDEFRLAGSPKACFRQKIISEEDKVSTTCFNAVMHGFGEDTEC